MFELQILLACKCTNDVFAKLSENQSVVVQAVMVVMDIHGVIFGSVEGVVEDSGAGSGSGSPGDILALVWA